MLLPCPALTHYVHLKLNKLMVKEWYRMVKEKKEEKMLGSLPKVVHQQTAS